MNSIRMKCTLLIAALAPSACGAASEPDANDRLFEAVRAKSTTAVSEAAIGGADLLTARDPQGRSPLLVAYMTGSFEVFEYLLLGHVDPNAPAGKSGNSILASLVSPNAYPFLEAFLRFGGDINAPLENRHGEPEPYLVTVARLGRVDLCYGAIQAGAKIDVRDSQGRTVLGAAVENESFQTAYFLLKWGVAVEADLAPGAFDSVLGKSPEVGALYWHGKFVEELARSQAQRR